MGTPTPWQIAARGVLPKRRRVETYAYDPYNFSHITTTNGTNVAVVVPAIGPNAAGRISPTSARTLIGTTIVGSSGTEVVVYGNNFGDPKH